MQQENSFIVLNIREYLENGDKELGNFTSINDVTFSAMERGAALFGK